MKVTVLIPSYNEEKTIAGIVKEIKALGFRVIVVDDGSSDNTKKAAQEAGAIVIRNIKNMGKGISLKEGFELILKSSDADAVLVMDGDGQHNPRDIQRFIKEAEGQKGDIIAGNRMNSTKNMPFIRLATNKFMSSLISSICKQRIPDTQCGFRLFKRKVLENIEIQSERYDIESELLIKASRKGFKISSVPIETIYTGEVSRINPVKDTIRFIGLVVKSYFKWKSDFHNFNYGSRTSIINAMDYKAMRSRMVEEQLVPRGISDKRVLEAFRNVERHEFIPANLRESAYEDHPLPIGEEQTISQPYMVALMTECLGLKGGEKILEIGTGSGYQAAILAGLAKEVYSVERVAALAKSAEGTLKRLGYDNVKIRVGDGTLGWEDEAPFDGIIVTAAAPRIPDSYISQLKAGGKLVIPVGDRFSQVLTVVEKNSDGAASAREVCGCVFVPLVGKHGWR